MRNTADSEVVAGGSGAVLGITDDFASFKGKQALLKAHLPRAEVDWAYYQDGPKGSTDPIIFLHGTSGTAAAFFYQVEMLSAKGFRVISAQYPAYGTLEEWSKGFDHFLDLLRCKAAHVFGAGLGGYLAQHFASRYPHRVRSLILCNAFASTRSFADKAGALASVVHITPTPILRRMILDSLISSVPMTLQVKQAVDFVASQVEEISGTDIAGRLSLNSTENYVGALNLDDARITLIETAGETMVPEELRRELRHRYSAARVAELKYAGDFPFLSQPDEVALFVEVHMRGIGVFAGGRAPSFSDASPESSPAARKGSGYAGSGRSVPSAAAPAAVLEEPAPAPVRRPKWINPFDDPPVRPRANPFADAQPSEVARGTGRAYQNIEDDPLL